MPTFSGYSRSTDRHVSTLSRTQQAKGPVTSAALQRNQHESDQYLALSPALLLLHLNAAAGREEIVQNGNSNSSNLAQGQRGWGCACVISAAPGCSAIGLRRCGVRRATAAIPTPVLG